MRLYDSDLAFQRPQVRFSAYGICSTITHLLTPLFLPMNLSMFLLPPELSYKDTICFGYES
jgi:hypothetical protein